MFKLFHDMTSLHPPSFQRNDFSTCNTDERRLTQHVKLMTNTLLNSSYLILPSLLPSSPLCLCCNVIEFGLQRDFIPIVTVTLHQVGCYFQKHTKYIICFHVRLFQKHYHQCMYIQELASML